MKLNILIITSLTLLIDLSVFSQEQMEVEGAIKIDAAASTTDGTIEYGTSGGILDFWGRKNGIWKSLTAGGSSGSSLWTDDGTRLFPFNNTRKVIIGHTSSIGSARVVVGSSTSPNYDGITVNSGSTGKPFYGYALGGSVPAWTYVDGSSSSKDWIVFNGADRMRIANTGLVTITNLSGIGNRMVIADAAGILSTQAISSGGDDLGNHTATTDINASNNKVINVAAPNTSTDAANKAYVDAHTDADANPSNETISAASLSGTTLNITEAGTTHSVNLSSLGGGGGSSPWTVAGSDINYTSGNVGIGTTSPTQPLDVVTGSSQAKSVLVTNNSTFGTAIEAKVNVNSASASAIRGVAPDLALAGNFQGRTKVTKSLNIGTHPTSSVAPVAGDMQWSGSDYEGYDGSTWQSFTQRGCEIGTLITSIPYTISTPGYYYLESNLVLSSAGSHGITISADNVTINLNGFELKGTSTTGSNYGIYFDQYSGANIINGYITNWNTGIGGYNNLGKGATIENVQCNKNEYGFYLEEFDQVSIINCKALSNGSTGIYFEGHGLIVKNCIASDNGGSGISASCLSGTVENSVADYNGGNGISLYQGSRMVSCVANYNGNDGIVAYNNNTISSCVAFYNNRHGFNIENENILADNESMNNGQGGTGFGYYLNTTSNFMRYNVARNHPSGPIYNIPPTTRLLNNWFF